MWLFYWRDDSHEMSSFIFSIFLVIYFIIIIIFFFFSKCYLLQYRLVQSYIEAALMVS